MTLLLILHFCIYLCCSWHLYVYSTQLPFVFPICTHTYSSRVVHIACLHDVAGRREHGVGAWHARNHSHQGKSSRRCGFRKGPSPRQRVDHDVIVSEVPSSLSYSCSALCVAEWHTLSAVLENGVSMISDGIRSAFTRGFR